MRPRKAPPEYTCTYIYIYRYVYVIYTQPIYLYAFLPQVHMGQVYHGGSFLSGSLGLCRGWTGKGFSHLDRKKDELEDEQRIQVVGLLGSPHPVLILLYI